MLVHKIDQMRSIKNIHQAINAPIDDLITYRAMPTGTIDHLDPFLFLNHHGPQVYGPNNNGLPFGPHPHRGFETLTFILDGDLMHWDSSGGKNIISKGGIQWMTAGRGLIHAEISSEEFKAKGGRLEIIQLWINLPAKLKMTEPAYTGLQKDKIPIISMDDGKAELHVISGKFENIIGPVKSLTEISVSWIEMKKDGTYRISVDKKLTILFYVVKGEIVVNGSKVSMHHLIEFDDNAEEIVINAFEDSTLIFGYGEPFNEPIVAQGPFVMNYPAEIKQAYIDFQTGKMGTWEE
jgi:quercetin 2,3-dioxygenase